MYTYIRQNVQIKYPRAALFLASLRVDHPNIHRDVPIFTTREVMVLSVDLILSLVWNLQAAQRLPIYIKCSPLQILYRLPGRRFPPCVPSPILKASSFALIITSLVRADRLPVRSAVLPGCSPLSRWYLDNYFTASLQHIAGFILTLSGRWRHMCLD